MQIFEKSFEVNSLNVNVQKRLGLVGLLGMLQETAFSHADQMGIGYLEMLKSNSFWVLTRQELKMDTYPALSEVVTIKTWSRPLDNMVAYRDFEIYVKNQKIGESSTSWMVIDGQSRKPILPQLKDATSKTRADYKLNFSPEKIPAETEETGPLLNMQVRNNDLDMNMHVNNVKYTQWVLDAIPIQLQKNKIVSRYQINFLSEAFIDDHVLVIAKEMSNSEAGDQYYFEGKNAQSDQAYFRVLLESKPIFKF